MHGLAVGGGTSSRPLSLPPTGKGAWANIEIWCCKPTLVVFWQCRAWPCPGCPANKKPAAEIIFLFHSNYLLSCGIFHNPFNSLQHLAVCPVAILMHQGIDTRIDRIDMAPFINK
jgi:hypothetical protein